MVIRRMLTRDPGDLTQLAEAVDPELSLAPVAMSAHVRAFMCAPYPPSARAFRSRSAASECAGQVEVLRPLSSAVALAATRLGPATGVSAVSGDHRPLPALRVKRSCQAGRTAR